MALRICIGGITGWTGKELAKAVVKSEDLELVAGVSRKEAGQRIENIPVYGDVASALGGQNCDVYLDYTHPSCAKSNVLQALELGVAVIIGTSGLTAKEYEEIDKKARAQRLGVVASGNFSLTASLLQRLAMIAAKHVPDYEIIDYAKAAKPDAPSGTARELAERLGAIAPNHPGVPIADIIGPKEIRGADIGGGRVHSVRVPGFVLSVEAIFGAEGERLVLRHDAGESARPYVSGTLLAARRVVAMTGLTRGLDTLLFGAMD